MSSTVSSTWPTRSPCRAKASPYRATSNPWPTLAAACWVARSRGRRTNPSGASPAAIAPEDTRTTSRPERRARATKAGMGASRAVQQLCSCLHGGPPVEDDCVVAADDHLGTRRGTRLQQRLLHPEASEPVGQVADGLVVGEVGLPDPPLRLCSADSKQGALATDREPGIVNGRRA